MYLLKTQHATFITLFVRWLGWIGGVFIGAKILLSIGIQVWPVPTPPWARGLLHSRWRRRYRDPARTLELLRITPGMRVLELGPGSGLFTAEAARLVSPHGQLLSVDLQIEMLRPLHEHVQEAELRNVFLSAATAEHLPFADNSVDLVFAIAVLPMIRNKQQALRELRRVLSPHGVLAVSEDLIEPEYVPAFIIRHWCQRAGFMLTERIHRRMWYMLLFRPACKSHNHEDTKT